MVSTTWIYSVRKSGIGALLRSVHAVAGVSKEYNDGLFSYQYVLLCFQLSGLRLTTLRLRLRLRFLVLKDFSLFHLVSYLMFAYGRC